MDKFSTHHRLRLAVAVLATAVTGTALASAGFAGLRALDLGPAAASQYPGKKVTVCHRTHSKKHPWVKIRVSRKALKAHMRHGDFVVDDAHPCPPANKHKSKHKQHAQGGKHKGKSKPKKQNDESAAKHGSGGKGKGHGQGNGRGHGKK